MSKRSIANLCSWVKVEIVGHGGCRRLCPRDVHSTLTLFYSILSPKYILHGRLFRICVLASCLHLPSLMTSASAASQSWPPEQIPPSAPYLNHLLLTSIHPPHLNSVGYLSRKALPIKRNDAEPLTRDDVQFDLLNYIFSDTRAVFSTPYPSKSPKIPFGELYVSALYNSTKCSKVLKDKMLETPAFGIELAKISLLTNVGRINTTMACTKCLSSCGRNS